MSSIKPPGEPITPYRGIVEKRRERRGLSEDGYHAFSEIRDVTEKLEVFKEPPTHDQLEGLTGRGGLRADAIWSSDEQLFLKYDGDLVGAVGYHFESDVLSLNYAVLARTFRRSGAFEYLVAKIAERRKFRTIVFDNPIDEKVIDTGKRISDYFDVEVRFRNLEFPNVANYLDSVTYGRTFNKGKIFDEKKVRVFRRVPKIGPVKEVYREELPGYSGPHISPALISGRYTWSEVLRLAGSEDNLRATMKYVGYLGDVHRELGGFKIKTASQYKAAEASAARGKISLTLLEQLLTAEDD